MPMSTFDASAGSTYKNVLKIEQGGSHATTPAGALSALNGVPSTQIGQAGGPIPLGANGLPDLSYFDGVVLEGVAVDGPTTMGVGETAEFFLTTYDTFTHYDVTAAHGTVNIEKGVITYTAPATPGVRGFSINGRQVNVLISSAPVIAPAITAPVNGSYQNDMAPTLVSSAFVPAFAGDSHVASDWQISYDEYFSELAESSYFNTTDLVTWTSPTLVELRTYYARVRYHSSMTGVGAWSPAISFTTRSDGLLNKEIARQFQIDQIPVTGYGEGLSISPDGAYIANAEPYRERGIVTIFAHEALLVKTKQVIAAPLTNCTYFGKSVAFSENGLVLAIGEGSGSFMPGRVFIYTRNPSPGSSWVYSATINTPAPIGGDEYVNFGAGVAITADGTRLAVSAPNAYYNGMHQGLIYFFQKVSTFWTQIGIVASPTGIAGGLFGQAMALSGDGARLLAIEVGAPSRLHRYHLDGSDYLHQYSYLQSQVDNLSLAAAKLALNQTGSRLLVGSRGSARVQLFEETALAYQSLYEVSILGQRSMATWGRNVALSGDATTAVMSADSGNSPGVGVFVVVQ